MHEQKKKKKNVENQVQEPSRMFPKPIKNWLESLEGS